MEILAETMKTNDIKSCTSVSTKELQTKCTNDIYFRRAISESNPALCKEISDTNQEQQCNTDTERIMNEERN